MGFRDFFNVATKTPVWPTSWKHTWLHQMDENVVRGTSKDEERREAYLKLVSPQQTRTRLAVEHGRFQSLAPDYQGCVESRFQSGATQKNPCPYTLSSSTPRFRNSFFPFRLFVAIRQTILI